MTKAELFVVLDDMQGVDPDFQISVIVTKDNPVGFLCLASDVHPEMVKQLMHLGAVIHPDGMWCLDLSKDLPWRETEDVNERQ